MVFRNVLRAFNPNIGINEVAEMGLFERAA